MKRFFEKIKTKLKKKKQTTKSVSECHICGGSEFEALGEDKYCKNCGAVF